MTGCAGPLANWAKFARLLFLEARIVGRDALSANIPRDHVYARAGDFIGTHVCWHYNRKFRIRRSLNRSLQFFLTVICAVERSNCIPTAKRGGAPEIQGRWMLGWMLRRARRHQGRHHQIPAHKRERSGVAGFHSLILTSFSTVRQNKRTHRSRSSRDHSPLAGNSSIRDASSGFISPSEV